jgi:putative flavoprotein involved in K+ transport
VRDGRPVLADGRVVEVANVVWCTGFRQDFSWIELPVIGDDGWPLETRGVVPSSPGLYFVGLPFQYAFASMLVGGAGRDAEYVVKHLCSRQPADQRAETALHAA